MAGNINIIQPAHATQVSVEKIFQTRPHQPEIEQRHIQEEIRKASEQKHEQTQQLDRSDTAVIREKKKEERNKKKKKDLAKKVKQFKEQEKLTNEKRQNFDGKHLDIKI